METGLHNLCDSCSMLSFALHEPSECSELDCNYNDKTPPFAPLNRRRCSYGKNTNRHSAIEFVSESIEDLKASARAGCHLCTLFHFALTTSPGSLSAPFSDRCLPGEVVVVLVEIIQEYAQTEHEIVVICDTRYSVLSVTPVPPAALGCSGMAYAGMIWKLPEATVSHLPGYIEGATKFYARCVNGKGPFIMRRDGQPPEHESEEINGIPRLINYMPGQIVNVYEDDGLWLVGFTNGIAASIHQYNHPLFGYVESEDFIPLMKPVHPGCNCGKGVWEPPLIATIGGGQTSYINPDPASDEVFTLIKTWLSDCVENHEACRFSTGREMPTRVLDVGTLESPCCRLQYGLDPDDKFVTLSYRWGDTLAFTTTKATLQSRMAGIAFEELPRTLQDAVTVTRKLGLRYLWIDALCIIQDSVEDWDKESAKMGQVYANAYVNISAGCAANTESGFLNKRNPLELQSCEHPTLIQGYEVPWAICPNIPRPDRILNSDILNTRGWILQERALSKRTIHFGPYEVYWECLLHSATEREPEDFRKSFASQQNQDSQSRRETWLTIRSGLHYIQNRSAEDLLHILGDGWLEESRQQEPHTKWLLRNLAGKPKVVGRFNRTPEGKRESCYLVTLPNVKSPEASRLEATNFLWYLLIEDYSLRALTKRTDQLPAVSGLAQVFKASLGGEGYIAGLWVSDIIQGLCWVPVLNGGRERPTLLYAFSSLYHQQPYAHSVPSPPVTTLVESSEKEDSDSIYVAPSFSWASIKGPISVMARRDETPVGMTIESPYKATILHVQSTLATADPFGRITDASITIRSYTLPYKVAMASHQSTKEESVIFDRPHEAQSLIDDDRLLCLAIQSRMLKSNNPSHMNGEEKCCLLIVPEDADTADGKTNNLPTRRYRRVGFIEFYVSKPNEGKSECPDCDLCKSGILEAMKALWDMEHSKTDEEKAADREKEEKRLAAIGYAQWQLQDVVLV